MPDFALAAIMDQMTTERPLNMAETLRALFRGAEFVLGSFGGGLGHEAAHGKARKAYSSEEEHLAKRGKASLVTEHLFVVLKHVVEEGN